MSELLDKVEIGFSAIGLGKSPFIRGLAMGTLITVAEEAFFKGGDNVFFKGTQHRPWSALSDDKEATPFPWWMPGAFGFVAFGMFL